MALDDLRHNPQFGFLALKTLRRIVYYWTGFWSFSADELRDQPYTPENVFYVSTVTLFMLLGIRSLWRTNRTTAMPYLLLIGSFPITYYLTHPMMDYRQPLEPAVIVLAVAGALAIAACGGRQIGSRSGSSRASIQVATPRGHEAVAGDTIKVDGSNRRETADPVLWLSQTAAQSGTAFNRCSLLQRGAEPAAVCRRDDPLHRCIAVSV